MNATVMPNAEYLQHVIGETPIAVRKNAHWEMNMPTFAHCKFNLGRDADGRLWMPPRNTPEPPTLMGYRIKHNDQLNDGEVRLVASPEVNNMLIDGPADQFTHMDAAVHILGSAAIAIREQQGEPSMELACMCAIGDRPMASLDPIERMFVWWSRTGTDQYDPLLHKEAQDEIWPYLRENQHLIPDRLRDAFNAKYGTRH